NGVPTLDGYPVSAATLAWLLNERGLAGRPIFLLTLGEEAVAEQYRRQLAGLTGQRVRVATREDAYSEAEDEYSRVLSRALEDSVVRPEKSWDGGSLLDPFDIGRPRDAPDFLRGYDYSKLPTSLYPAFLERLSLTRDRPSRDDLTPKALKGFNEKRKRGGYRE